jgi:ketosteroid isomerase-like protein
MRNMAVLLLALAATAARADDRAVALEYIRARCAVLTTGATERDVDRVMAVLHDDAVVEHPKFGAVVRGKEAIRRGISSHLHEYTGDAKESGILVLGSVESPGAVAFRTRISFVTGEGAERKPITREGLIIVEIREGLISRLIEY